MPRQLRLTPLTHTLAFTVALTLTFTSALRAQNPPPQRPDLVVLIAIDQLRQDYLERWADQFTGGFKRLREQGAYFTNAFQDHAVTYTAVGHSTMLSGRFPRSTGIISNELGVPDPEAHMLNGRGEGASPFRFRGSTLFDWIRVQDPFSRALSVSVKDRAAILPLGRAKQSVFWYSTDGTFTTSDYYADTLPTWIRRFNAAKLPEKYAGRTWQLLLPAKMYPEADTVPFDPKGRSYRFPHAPPSDLQKATAQLANFPWMDEILLDLARTGADSMRLGRSGHVDVLSMSLSTMDLIGHAYGPDSREVHDQVLRLDRAIGAFLDSLDRRFQPGHYVVVLTADHGVSSFPELNPGNRSETGEGHLDVKPLLATLRPLLTAHNAPGSAVAFEGGMLMLDEVALHHDHVLMDSIARIFADGVVKLPGVLRVDWVRDLAKGDTINDLIIRRWNQMIPRDLAIPVVATIKPTHMWGSGNPATHGTPWDPDAHVPIIFFGPQFRAGRYADFVRTVDIAPTLAALLDVHPTEPLDGKPLLRAFTTLPPGQATR